MSRSYSSLLSWFALALATSLMLYHTSDRVNALNRHLHDLDSQIEAERQSMHVLKAEWVYLANPARVEAAVHRHLNLQPTETRRVVAMKDIGSLLPLHDGIETPPVEVADNSPAPATGAIAAHTDISILHPAHSRNERAIAALNAGHLNDHMLMPRSAALESSGDGIGGIINSLSLHP